VPAEELLVDRAQPADADRPEMTVLVGGLRVLNANVGQSPARRLHRPPETLTNDFFVNLLDMGTSGRSPASRARLRGPRPQDRRGEVDRHPRRPRLRLELAAAGLAEVYACDDAQEKFVRDFVAAWTKVMNLDRFDLGVPPRGPVATRPADSPSTQGDKAPRQTPDRSQALGAGMPRPSEAARQHGPFPLRWLLLRRRLVVSLNSDTARQVETPRQTTAATASNSAHR
jgi:hypothetical protein